MKALAFRLLLVVIALVSVSLLTAILSSAQPTEKEYVVLRGVISDTARPPGPLPGVVIEARNFDTNRSYQTTTDLDGQYELSLLDEGTYEVEARLTGFVTQLQKGFSLRSGQERKLDFTLQLNLDEAICILTIP